MPTITHVPNPQDCENCFFLEQTSISGTSNDLVHYLNGVRTVVKTYSQIPSPFVIYNEMNEFLLMKMKEAKKTDMTLEKIHQQITSIEAKIDSLLEENASLKKQLSSTERRLENQIAWNFELRQILFGMGE